MTVRAVRSRIETLVRRDDVEVVGATIVGPKRTRAHVYRSVISPAAVDDGLTHDLAVALSTGRYLTRYADIAGFAVPTVHYTIRTSGLDAPSTDRREVSRAVCATAALRLARSLEDDAAQLREWAERARRADRGAVCGP